MNLQLCMIVGHSTITIVINNLLKLQIFMQTESCIESYLTHPSYLAYMCSYIACIHMYMISLSVMRISTCSMLCRGGYTEYSLAQPIKVMCVSNNTNIEIVATYSVKN